MVATAPPRERVDRSDGGGGGGGDGGGPGAGAATHRVGLVAGVLLFLAMLLAPTPPGMTPEAQRLVAVVLLMGAWWMTEAIPLGATALLPLALFPLLGILGPAEASAPYAEPAVFLFLGGFLLAKAFERSGLHRRVALAVLARTGGGPRGVLLGFMAVTALLSMWVSNTATALMMLPIGAAVAASAPAVAGAARGNWRYPFPTVLMLGIAYAASIGGIATLIGTPPNVVFAGQARRLVPDAEVGFVQWMAIGVPLAAAYLLLAWAWLAFVAWDPATGGPRAGERLRDARRALGAPTRAEKTVLAVFLSTILLWVFRVDVDLGAGLVVPGWATRLGLDAGDATVAIAAAILLFLLPVGGGRRALDWPTAVRLPWEVLLLFGGGFALGAGFRATGLGEWIARQLAGLAAMPEPLLLLVLALVVIGASEIASNTALTGLLLPILAATAPALGIDPLLLMLTATLAASCGFMLPVATPPNAVAYATGHVKAPQMARAGAALDVIGAVLVTLAVLLLGRVALGLG